MWSSMVSLLSQSFHLWSLSSRRSFHVYFVCIWVRVSACSSRFLFPVYCGSLFTDAGILCLCSLSRLCLDPFLSMSLLVRVRVCVISPLDVSDYFCNHLYLHLFMSPALHPSLSMMRMSVCSPLSVCLLIGHLCGSSALLLFRMWFLLCRWGNVTLSAFSGWGNWWRWRPAYDGWVSFSLWTRFIYCSVCFLLFSCVSACLCRWFVQVSL